MMILQEAIESVPLAVAILEPDGETIVQGNRKFSEMYGYSEKEIVGLSMRCLLAPEAISRFALASEIFAERQHEFFKSLQERKNHTHFLGWMTVTRFQQDPQGRYFCGVIKGDENEDIESCENRLRILSQQIESALLASGG